MGALAWQAFPAQVAGVGLELQDAKNKLLSKRDEELDVLAQELDIGGNDPHLCG